MLDLIGLVAAAGAGAAQVRSVYLALDRTD